MVNFVFILFLVLIVILAPHLVVKATIYLFF